MSEDIVTKIQRIFADIQKHADEKEETYLRTPEAQQLAVDARAIIDAEVLTLSGLPKNEAIRLVQGYTLGHFVCGVETAKMFDNMKADIAKALKEDGIDPQIMQEIVDNKIPLKAVKNGYTFVALTKIFGKFPK